MKNMKAGRLLLLLLCAPLQAADLPDLLRRPPAEAAQAAIKRLPAAAQTELFTLYARYRDLVERRGAEGWRSGLLTEDIMETPGADVLPARQLEETLRKRTEEVSKLETRLAKTDTAGLRRSLEAARLSLEALRRQDARPKGTCLDWSDAAWADFSAANPKYWEVSDVQRQARPFHTGARLCAAAGPRAVCLVFDPWARGEADVHEQGAWDEDSPLGRLPADFFMHELPEPKPQRPARARGAR
ncbi:MAG: hypothetical protein PHF00_12035 [Elusimicrobia bacterium]|nr:hypothetical protein [Elusimicrobiota bacterium]